MTDDVADALLAGPRRRRLCLEYARELDPAMGEVLFWLAHRADQHPGTMMSFGSSGNAPVEPDYSRADLVDRLSAFPSVPLDTHAFRAALRMSVDTAMYWQEPDGTDIVASWPEVISALRPVAESIAASAIAQRWDAPRSAEQWAVDWRIPSDASPLPSDTAAILQRWDDETRADELRAQRERPVDPRARWSGTWWSVPTNLLSTRGRVADALELVEDAFNWEDATIVPVRGAGRTLEIRSPDDWASLCRTYPVEVTASRRHDWYRVTGRDGRWLIPDWLGLSEEWDAVHLSTMAYLRSATALIEIDSEYASVIGGWAPDSTFWLTDAAREWEEPRQHWTRPQSNDEWNLKKGGPL